VAALTTRVATHQPIATTGLEARAAPGAGPASIGPMRHDSNLRFGCGWGYQAEREQQQVLVAAGLAEHGAASHAQSQVGLLEAERTV
jgi:hypothetical protein